MRRLQSEFRSLEEKLQRTVQQMHKFQTSFQRRRSISSETAPEQQQLEGDICNAEMQCHAESLRALLDGLYKAIGYTGC